MRLFPFLALLLFSPCCLSQEARPVECRFLGFGVNENQPSMIALNAKGGDIVCPLPGSQLSKKITCYATGDRIPFLSADDRKPLASARIPAGAGSVIIILAPAGKPEDPSALRAFVIEDSPKNFPDGGAFVANFQPGEIRFVIGEHKGMLRAGGAHGYAMPEQRDDFNMSPVIVEFRNGEKWRTANESALRFLPGMRYLILAHVDPLSGRPRIKTYQDIAPPKGAP